LQRLSRMHSYEKLGCFLIFGSREVRNLDLDLSSHRWKPPIIQCICGVFSKCCIADISWYILFPNHQACKGCFNVILQICRGSCTTCGTTCYLPSAPWLWWLWWFWWGAHAERLMMRNGD
jgi:hypothetical protein